MKKITQLVLIGLTLSIAACNGNAADGAAAQAADDSTAVQVSTNFSFLARAGVDTTQLFVMPIAPIENMRSILDTMIYLNEDQQKNLLNGALHYDVGVSEHEGYFSLLGVRPLPGGYTLVVYNDSFGDIGLEHIAVYDGNGKMTDYLYAGEWFAWGKPDEDHTGKMHYQQGKMQITGTNSFEVTNTLSYIGYEEVDYVCQPRGEAFWQVTTRYQYTVDDVGHILYVDTKSQTKGQGAQEPSVMQSDFENIQRQPMSDVTRIDRLNDLAVRDDVLADLKEGENGRAEYLIITQLGDFYEKLQQQLLSWMAAHDGPSNHLLPYFEQMFREDLVKKSGLVKHIGMMPDAKARAKMERLTAQWGPEDAEG